MVCQNCEQKKNIATFFWYFAKHETNSNYVFVYTGCIILCSDDALVKW